MERDSYYNSSSSASLAAWPVAQEISGGASEDENFNECRLLSFPLLRQTKN